ncbi:MAG: ABC transporter substrate-binding protein [Chitinivibrionales bacterium]
MKKLNVYFWVIFAIFLVRCSSTRMNVLIRMIDEQENYFGNEVIPPFEKSHSAEIEVFHYNSPDELIGEIDNYPDMHLVKVPFSEAYRLVDRGALMPLDDFLSKEQIKEYKDTYLLTSLAEFGGKHYMVPRKFETRIMVYRKSKVAEAQAQWRRYQPSIHEALKKINGYGLPATYLLEQDPNQWDYYDVFVVGWIWAHADGDFSGGRVAHRAKRYFGTAQRIMDRIFQCGGDSTALITMSGDPVVDAMHWEAVYAFGGIYNSRMWEQGWSGPDIWRGFGDDEVYLSFMTQLDCFYLHGTGRDGLGGYLSDPDDMGVAVMPRGCSVQLDEKGNIKRQGRNAITTGGWWWAIPAKSSDPHNSYELARHITNAENQIQGCSRFGMIPVRKDILSDMNLLFGGTWISKIYSVSFQQLMHNKKTTVPAYPDLAKVIGSYLDAWHTIIVQGQWASQGAIPDRQHIESVMRKYASGLPAAGEVE